MRPSARITACAAAMLAFAYCAKEDNPVRFTTTGMDYDSVLAYIITVEKPDTGTPRLDAMFEVTMVLKNKAGRALSIDSAYNGTLLYASDSAGSRVWASPASFTGDSTGGRRVPMAAGDSLTHWGLWRPVVDGVPLRAGSYTLSGWMCGFRTDARTVTLR